MQPNAQIVKQTYFRRYNEMPLEYKLHFASRLYAWNKDSDALALLSKIQDEVVPGTSEERRQNLFAIKEELLTKDYERDVNDYARRRPFFDRYPELLLIHNALFRIRHWLCIYNIDERATLFELVPREKIIELLLALRADDEAKKILSTYFINATYLFEKLYPDANIPKFDPAEAVAVGNLYDIDQPSDVRLLIYLYTHCIIGETLFYFKPVESYLTTYQAMLEQLERVIEKNYDSINLDNKCEFLVCARICNYSPSIAERIYDEATHSLNDEGFIVDVHNSAINPVKQSFVMSEHRNVLYIMSFSKPAFL